MSFIINVVTFAWYMSFLIIYFAIAFVAVWCMVIVASYGWKWLNILMFKKNR